MSPINPVSPPEIIEFWFSEPVRKQWFGGSEELDEDIRQRHHRTWEAARDGRLSDWENSAAGALALVIVLDQLPLNMFRGQPQSFSTEAASREVAERAIAAGLDRQLSDSHKLMLYLPYMHGESIADQDRAIALFTAAGMTENVQWANHHRDIVQRFGRFPHRNAILGRDSSAEEIAWLDSPDGFKG